MKPRLETYFRKNDSNLIFIPKFLEQDTQNWLFLALIVRVNSEHEAKFVENIEIKKSK